uniref:NADH-ubiquinone oxidoreductase chain 6 n=1 Tax=Cucujoidea sp. 3 KM-2017 TaxID=2219367 RepID=A0A346RH40_9CUCU|nr:NADH dehydrogenase subunit 6 [Cucujoidea sp. 3 KM-2017]
MNLIILFYLSMIFMFMNHPISMGTILLISTILVALTTGSLLLNFWYSYILFLIMIGGMLILFMYMTNVASNEKFKFSNKLFLFLIPMLFFLKMNFINPKNLNFDIKMSLLKYFYFPNNLMLMMMMIYLLITLIAVIKIINIKNGPLRQST